MSNTHKKTRSGFILAEALVALTIFGVAFLALEGSLTVALRSLAESDREAVATRLAETARERAFGSSCVDREGNDSVNSVVLAWVTTAADGLVRITENSSYPRRIGVRSQHYDAVGRCE